MTATLIGLIVISSIKLNVIFKITFFLYFIFYIGFVVDAVFVYYLPAYHSANTLSLLRIFILCISGFIFIMLAASRKLKLKKNEARLIFIFIFLSLLASMVAFYNGNPLNKINPWIVSYISFVFIFIISSASIYNLSVEDELNFLGFLSLSILFIFGAANLIMLFSQRDNYGVHFSVSLYILGVPLAYFLAGKKIQLYGLLITLFLSIITFKRGLWVAVIVTIICALLYSGKRYIGVKKIIYLVFTACISLLITLFFLNDQFFEILNFKMKLEADGGFDAISSGRFSVMYSLVDYLGYNLKWLFGAGFGSTFDAFKFFDDALSTWVTDGVDIIFGQLWLTHGYILGSAIFFWLVIFLLQSLKCVYFKNDFLFRFFVLVLLFNFVASLFSFVYFDLIWPIIIGMLMSRRSFLSGCAK